MTEVLLSTKFINKDTSLNKMLTIYTTAMTQIILIFLQVSTFYYIR
jgi:heme/copper-type cytochrome/quinol oxidase subunit 2